MLQNFLKKYLGNRAPPKTWVFDKKFSPTWPKYSRSDQLLLRLESVSLSCASVQEGEKKGRPGYSVAYTMTAKQGLLAKGSDLVG